jgi:DNA-binding response OmpR family regulator
VLLVEDTPDRQEILTSLYKNQAWILVHTGRRALTLLSAFVFDIVSIDYNLGDDLTGVDVVRALRQSESAGCLVVVHSLNPRGAAEILAIAPEAIAYPVSKMARSNAVMKTLRAGVDALGPKFDFTV